jgi:hypothetical protein
MIREFEMGVHASCRTYNMFHISRLYMQEVVYAGAVVRIGTGHEQQNPHDLL